MRIELEFGVGVGFWCAVFLLAHPPCYIIRFQWCQFVLNELMILGVRNAIRKCHEMNEGSVIVVLAHHDALILPYEFLVVFSSTVCFSCIFEHSMPFWLYFDGNTTRNTIPSAIIYRIHTVFSCSYGLRNPTAWYAF